MEGYGNENPGAFQSPRPLRGATCRGRRTTWRFCHFNPRAPCGARLVLQYLPHELVGFQPTRPLRGATASFSRRLRAYPFQPTRPLRGATSAYGAQQRRSKISTHAPLAGRDFALTLIFHRVSISTHAPLAGRDSKSVQITMHIFAITDKFQMLLHRMPPVRAFCSFLMQENHADFGCEPPK